MDVSSTANAALNQQLAWLVRQGPGLSRTPDIWGSPFQWVSGADAGAPAPAKAAGGGEVAVAVRGTQTFGLPGEFVKVGGSGVMVKVSDLALDTDDRTTAIGGRRYVAPSFSRSAQATIVGTADADDMTISQDAQGNTMLEVRWNGRVESLNLGRIAGVTVSGGAGDDTISVRAENYFGGIHVSGGAGDDTIRVEADYTLKRGIYIGGDAGDDVLTVAGKAGAVLMEGGEGDDRLDMASLTPADGLSHELSGGAGNDMLFGSRGADVLNGGAGADLILAGEGDDRVTGGDGADTLHGGGGVDTMFGGAGDDRILGDDGNDLLYGEAGSDLLIGGQGGDTMSGGAGVDYLYGGGSVDELIRIGGTGRVEVSGLYNTLYGGEEADTLAPASPSPGHMVPYGGTGSYLPDYEPGVDILV